MTEQDKAEIRQMIREEFRKRGMDNIAVATVGFPAACFHEWQSPTPEIPYAVCRKCSAIQSNAFQGNDIANAVYIGGTAPAVNPNFKPAPTIDPKDSVITVSPTY